MFLYIYIYIWILYHDVKSLMVFEVIKEKRKEF